PAKIDDSIEHDHGNIYEANIPSSNNSALISFILINNKTSKTTSKITGKSISKTSNRATSKTANKVVSKTTNKTITLSKLISAISEHFFSLVDEQKAKYKHCN
ncbi:13848_t:CDS:1, partial [Dentiscutata heterogama]